jgi:hypothetical protein
MKIEKKEIIISKKIVQITTTDERFYEIENGEYRPSLTFVNGFYFKKQLQQWYKTKTPEEIDQILGDTSESGSIAHQLLERICLGEEVRCDQLFYSFMDEIHLATEDNIKAGYHLREIKGDEWKGIIDFINWTKSLDSFEVIATEMTVFNDRVAGTLDLIAKVNDEIWLIDFKTSKSATYYTSWDAQLAPLREMAKESPDPRLKKIDWSKVKCVLMQVGYTRNKAGIKINERTEEQMQTGLEMHDIAYRTWKIEDASEPRQIELPITAKLKEEPKTKDLTK